MLSEFAQLFLARNIENAIKPAFLIHSSTIESCIVQNKQSNDQRPSPRVYMAQVYHPPSLGVMVVGEKTPGPRAGIDENKTVAVMLALQ